MSWATPSLLVPTSEFAIYVDRHEPTEWLTGSTLHCTPDEPIAPYDIPVPGDGNVDFAADPGAIEFFGDAFIAAGLAFAPYYTLTARLTPPSEFSAWFNPPACKNEAPFEWDSMGPLIAGSVDGSFVDDTGAAMSMSISEMGLDFWLLEGNLVNPDPHWPTPDGAGNTFGSILFTAGQIATVSATIAITSGPPSTPVNDGLLEVYVQPYRFANTQQGHIMGWA